MSRPMNSLPTDEDLRNAMDALRRAALGARKLAQETKTPYYVWLNGHVADVSNEPTPAKVAIKTE